jgi:hypothetical protein
VLICAIIILNGAYGAGEGTGGKNIPVFLVGTVKYQGKRNNTRRAADMPKHPKEKKMEGDEVIQGKCETANAKLYDQKECPTNRNNLSSTIKISIRQTAT